jgi:hypothetical protein
VSAIKAGVASQRHRNRQVQPEPADGFGLARLFEPSIEETVEDQTAA